MSEAPSVVIRDSGLGWPSSPVPRGTGEDVGGEGLGWPVTPQSGAGA